MISHILLIKHKQKTLYEMHTFYTNHNSIDTFSIILSIISISFYAKSFNFSSLVIIFFSLVFAFKSFLHLILEG